MRRFRVVPTLALALTQVAYAQSRVALRGTVRAAADSTPVPLATVTLDRDPDVVMTDSAGVFVFPRVSVGAHSITVRRLGYMPTTTKVDTRSGDADVRIKLLPKMLNEVVISGQVVSVPYRFADVYRRGASGLGHFITREDIERRSPTRTADMLNGLPGIVAYSDNTVFQKCRKRPRAGTGAVESANKVQVYIDGRRMTRFDDSPGAADDAMASVSPNDIQAMEVYSGVAQLPGEFSVDACAVVLIWTKKY